MSYEDDVLEYGKNEARLLADIKMCQRYLDELPLEVKCSADWVIIQFYRCFRTAVENLHNTMEDVYGKERVEDCRKRN